MDAALLQFNAADPLAWKERMLSSDAPAPQKLAASAQAFEAVLLRQYLSEALQPLTKGGSVFGSGNNVYRYFITDALASGLSSAGAFGFSNLLQAQLAGALENHDDTADL